MILPGKAGVHHLQDRVVPAHRAALGNAAKVLDAVHQHGVVAAGVARFGEHGSRIGMSTQSRGVAPGSFSLSRVSWTGATRFGSGAWRMKLFLIFRCPFPKEGPKDFVNASGPR